MVGSCEDLIHLSGCERTFILEMLELLLRTTELQATARLYSSDLQTCSDWNIRSCVDQIMLPNVLPCNLIISRR